MKRSGYLLFLISFMLNLFLFTHGSQSQVKNQEKGAYQAQVIEKDPSRGTYKVKATSNTSAPQFEKIQSPPTRFEKTLAIQKHITAQQEELQKLLDAQQKGKNNRQQQQIVQIPRLAKIKFLGKETEFYEGPKLSHSIRSQATANTLVSNVLINGKQVDTIFAGDPFTISLSLAPNAVTAVMNIYIDINKNGKVDSSDLPIIDNGLLFDNGDEDINPVAGEYKIEISDGVYNSILSSLIFEVNNFQSVSSAQLVVKDKPSKKVIVGKITPSFPNTVVVVYSSFQNTYLERIVFPDSAGIVSLQFDTTANTRVNLLITSIDETPKGFIPPGDTVIIIKNDTTRFSRSFVQAKEFIEGYIKDQNGDPVVNAPVNVWNYCDGCSNRVQLNTVSDNTGYFKIGTRIGQSGVCGYTPSSTDEYMSKSRIYRYVQVGPNQTVRQDFEFLRSNAIISGTVKYNSIGTGGVPINGYNDSLSNSSFTGANGEYSLKVWKPSTGISLYTVSSNIGDYGYYLDSPYRQDILPGTTQVNFTIRKVDGGVKGKVTDIKTGMPIKNARLEFSGQTFRSTTSNDTGFYKISLQDGIYSLYVYSDYYDYYSENNITISGAIITKNIALIRSGSFSGTVTDESGNPITDADITVQDSTGFYIADRYSDVQGKYVISGLQTMSYKAVVSVTGYVKQWYDKKSDMENATPINVTKGSDTPNINFVLSRGGSISGVVKNKSGSAVPLVSIMVYDSLLNYSWGAQTDDSGKFFVYGLSTGKYYVAASSNDYITQWYNGKDNNLNATAVPVIINQNTPNINFVLLAGGIIAGKITDKIGNPIPSAEVAVYDSNFNSILYQYTNESGMYEIKKIPVGKKVYISVNKDQFSQRWYNNVSSFELATPITLSSEERKDNINFTLFKAGSVSGMVKNKAGIALQYANIYLIRVNGNSYYGSTGSDGTYMIGNLQSGKYLIEATSSGFVPQWYNQKSTWQLADTIIIEDEKSTTNIDFTLSDVGKITGTVRNTAGEPLSNAGIYANQIEGNSYYGYSDYLGNYTLSGIVSGKYIVYAYLSDYNTQWYNHRSTSLLAGSVAVEYEKTTANINFDLKAMTIDSVVVKIVVANLPDSVTFNQSHVANSYYDYWWGVRFEAINDSLQPDSNNDFETELAMIHAKFAGDPEFTADLILTTQHVLIRWQGNSGYNLYSNVRVWRNPNEKNTLYLAAPTSWWIFNNIGSTTKFYGNSIYYGANGQVFDKTNTGVGPTTINDTKGDVPFGGTDLISIGWKKVTPVSVKQVTALPESFELKQNYPNPFNPSTSINYQLPINSKVTLKIYDLLGREIATLVNEEQPAGWKEVQWNAKDVSSGIYFYKLTAGNYVEIKKMSVIK